MAEEGGLRSSSSSSSRLNNHPAVNGVDKRSNESTITFIRNLIVKRDREIADLKEMHENGNLTKDELDKLSVFSRDEFDHSKRQRISEIKIVEESVSDITVALRPPEHDAKEKEVSLIKEEIKVVATLIPSAVLNENLVDTVTMDIFVKVPSGESIKLKIRHNTRMRIIFLAISSQIGVADDILKFMFDGNTVEPEESASMLGIKDGDQIDCLIIGSDIVKTDTITLNIRIPNGGDLICKVTQGTRLDKIFMATASQLGVDKSVLRFFHQGRQLRGDGNETPSMFDMEDGDEIDYMMKQYGD
jgi:hypothetical protein